MDKAKRNIDDEAKRHFDETLAEYLRLLGVANVMPDLVLTFLPLLKRWNAGERSDELAAAMFKVE